VLTIADTPDALTPAWLTEALGAAGVLGDAEVVAVEMTPVGTGQMCDSVRVHLTFDRPTEAPPTIVAKLPAADPSSRAAAMALRNYEVEVRFYQELASTLPVRTPRAYHADVEVATASFVLLLEDLAPAQQGDQLAGCTPAEATVALDELVRLHAPRWGDESLAEVEWLHRDPEAGRAMLGQLLPTLWDGFRERYAERLEPAVHEAGDALFARLEAYLGADTEPWTVVHGDYRLDNLLLGGTSPAAVVDWQTCGHGPALSDVAYFVGGGLLPDDRRAHEHQLVRAYHDGLVAAGVTGYDFDRCWRDYRRGTWSGLVVAVAASMLVERTERGDDMFMVMAHRHAEHIHDLRAAELL
jgi:aminoglycoside/choline kinase family phosphotransferase